MAVTKEAEMRNTKITATCLLSKYFNDEEEEEVAAAAVSTVHLLKCMWESGVCGRMGVPPLMNNIIKQMMNCDNIAQTREAGSE